jgi:hypothetical protein
MRYAEIIMNTDVEMALEEAVSHTPKGVLDVCKEDFQNQLLSHLFLAVLLRITQFSSRYFLH